MGMDLNIYAARNHEVFNHEWWDNKEVTEKFYARKYWDLVNHCSFIPRYYESGEFLQLKREDINEMIQVACNYRDYFGTYNSVPKLCEIRDEFDDLEEQGYHLYLEYDW